LFSVLTFFASIGLAHPSGEIKTECGHARVVWCQDAGDGSDAGAEGANLRLMGLDTDDGRGERCVLGKLSNYAKPMFTPNGQQVIFSNRPERKIYMVGFDGSGLQSLSDGFALAVWRDPLTETDWVYAGTPVRNQTCLVDARRFRLDKPEISEKVWTKTPLDIDNFQISGDGKYACGVFPWPACGIAALPDREWKKFGDGCWPSLSPDNNLLLWIFDGAHRNLTVSRAKTDERWIVNINNAPGIDGFEVYHPRWSNHPRYMVMTGPYKIGAGANRIRGGGRDVEIFLGKFSDDFKKIERWIRVTHNQYADFFPDLWVAVQKKTAEPSCEALDREACPALRGDLALPAGNGPQENKKTSAGIWPVSCEGMVFFWQNKSKANTFADPVTLNSFVCRVEAKGRARYGRYFEMAPAGGAFIAEGGKGEILDECAASGQFALEALITPGVEAGTGDGTPSSRFLRPEVRPSPTSANPNLLPIIGYAAQNGSWDFLLGQKGGKLVFQLRSARGGPDYFFNLCGLSFDLPNHIIVSCSSSAVACYLNGGQIFSADSVYGGNWQRGKTVFGNECLPDYSVESGKTNIAWQGLIENVAIYSRWIGPEEARKKFKASLACAGEKKQLPLLIIRARALDLPSVPVPAAIAPYRRALVIGHYHIEEILEGKCSGREILVARWAILDGRVIESADSTHWSCGGGYGAGTPSSRFQRPEVRPSPADAEASPTGIKNDATIFMRLELFSDHPELEGERLIMDSERYDLPMYYEAGSY